MREINAAERRHVSGGAAVPGIELPSGRDIDPGFSRPSRADGVILVSIMNWIAGWFGCAKPTGPFKPVHPILKNPGPVVGMPEWRI
ncbi:hypothetical protein GR157_09195 [Burkholderia sp. 4701]|nr:hypothetical protein [Burkholderia sp. 4701]MXN81747.1 hypothetical protein [Burkholderia sp. 4812]